jgi:hypothetical protein
MVFVSATPKPYVYEPLSTTAAPVVIYTSADVFLTGQKRYVEDPNTDKTVFSVL